MDDARPIVSVIECLAKLADPCAQFGRFKHLLFLLAAQTGEGLAIDIFHRNATGAVVVDEIVNPHDMRMSQFEAALGLALELINHRTILNHQIGEKLEGDLPLQFLVARQPDNSHSSLAQDFDQPVASENFLSAGKVTRRRAGAVLRALVSHSDSVNPVERRRKFKRWRAELSSGSSGQVSAKARRNSRGARASIAGAAPATGTSAF